MADGLLRAMGGVPMFLRLPTPIATPGNSGELGLSAPIYQDVALDAVVVRDISTAKQQKFDESENAFGKYLQTATDPAGKAKVLLALGAVKIAAHKPDDAQKIAEQIMTLQPEGRVNAEARLLSGDVQFERGHFEDASKAFSSELLS